MKAIESLQGRLIRGNPARVLEYTIQQTARKLWHYPEAKEVISACGVTPVSFRDAAEELDALGLLSIDADLQSPIGIVRARLRPTGYLRAGPSVLPSVIRETYHVLSAAALLTKRDGAAPAETLLAGTKVPLARFDLTIEALVDLGLFTGSGPGDERWGKYRTVRVTALGRRALRGEDTLF